MRGVLLVTLLCVIRAWSSAQNVTVVLEKSAPVNTNFTTFSRLLSMTNVSSEINGRSSLTILVPDNSVLDAYVDTNLQGMHLDSLADFCRYHVLLQYLDIEEIMHMTNQTGLLITTLYQTTGRAEGIDGFLNMTFGNDIQFGLPPPHATGPLATVLNNFVRYPYNMSFMMVSKPLMPLKLGLKNRVDHFPSVDNALFQAGIYKTFQKLMQDTGVEAAVEDIEHQPFSPGVTVFAPTDTAFHRSGVNLAALSDAQKVALVQYHVLPSFFTFGSLRTQPDPLATLASTHDANFFINATSTRTGGLAVATGVTSATVFATIMEDDPVGVYAVDAVLLPPEIFIASPSPANPPQPAAASPPAAAPQASSPPPAAPVQPAPAPSSSTPPSPPSGSSSPPPAGDDGSVADAPGAAEGPLADRSSAGSNAAKFCVGIAAAVAALV